MYVTAILWVWFIFECNVLWLIEGDTEQPMTDGVYSQRCDSNFLSSLTTIVKLAGRHESHKNLLRIKWKSYGVFRKMITVDCQKLKAKMNTPALKTTIPWCFENMQRKKPKGSIVYWNSSCAFFNKNCEWKKELIFFENGNITVMRFRLLVEETKSFARTGIVGDFDWKAWTSWRLHVFNSSIFKFV